MVAPIFSPAELAEIQAYHAPHYLWGMVGDAYGLLTAAVTLRFVVRPLYARAESAAAWLAARLPAARSIPLVRAVPAALDALWGGPGWGAALLFSVLYLAWAALLYLPVDVYFDYLHEHRFGLSRYTPLAYALDAAKGFAVAVLAMGFLAFGLFGLARRVRRWWLVLGAVGAVLLLGSAALDPYRARLYFDQRPLEAGPLRDGISALMAKAGIDFRDVVVEHTSRASVRVQAYFAGRGPTRTIVLNDELLKALAPDEVLAAVAHEAGHVHEPRWPAQLASALALLGFLFLVDRLLGLVHRRGWFGVTERADLRALPLVLVVFSLLTSAVKPAVATVSRQREREADLYGLRLTGDGDAFARMLVKACRVNKMDPDPPRWAVLKGKSHPPIRERLEAVERGDWRGAPR